MKYRILILISILSIHKCFAQTATNLSITQEFANVTNTRGNGTSAMQSYTSAQTDGNQFFLPDWKKGEIISSNNVVFNSGFLFAYDKVRQEVFIRQRDSAVIVMGNKGEIKFFTLSDGGKDYHFANSILYTMVTPEFFYQILAGDSSKLTFLKYTRTTFVKADHADMMKQKEGNVYDAFVDNYTYYISKRNGEPKQVQLKTKSLKKTFADLNIDIDKYISDHPGLIDEDYVIALVTDLNK
jgi:hypothetical protein